MAHTDNLPETNAVESFLEWQQIEYEIGIDISALRFTEGKGGPIIMKDDMIMGKGYFGIIDYFKQNECLLC